MSLHRVIGRQTSRGVRLEVYPPVEDINTIESLSRILGNAHIDIDGDTLLGLQTNFHSMPAAECERLGMMTLAANGYNVERGSGLGDSAINSSQPS